MTFDDVNTHRTNDLELSIVMPCLNESATLAACIERARACLDTLGVAGEIIVADNGSTDGSPLIAEQSGARVVPVADRGYGAALRGGIGAARGQFVIMGDADRSYDFSALGPFLHELRGGADLVMGNRFAGRIEDGAMPWSHRRLGNPVLSGLGRLFFRSPVGDFHCGLRGFRRSAYEQLDLRTTGMEFASEMIIKSTLRGQRIAEVPITLSRDGRNRPPHLRTWRDGWRHLRFMLLFSPFWLFAVPGAVMFLAGLAGIAWLLPGPRHIGAVTVDIHSLLVASALCLAGHQVLVFGWFTKRFAISEGIHPGEPLLEKLEAAPVLELGIGAGALAIAGGVAWLAMAVYGWRALGFGDLDPRTTMRDVIPGVMLAMLGVQTIFASFFLGVLGLRRR